ncbi:MAG: nitrate reductase molybdenum cofactor assembly chaperone [Deltaproteobacteria bacterium]|nr:nitrate reductase molybdenum cofactor assembly chaperone [Deltaproteobacteria bacterium]
MLIYKILSRLIDYPDQDLKDNIQTLRELVKNEKDVARADHEAINDFLDFVESKSLIELEQNYVQTFDSRPETSLHLTHHLFGDDDRGRGPALINLGEHFKKSGLTPAKGELPDYLPLILEFIATLEKEQAGEFLGEAVKVLTVLADNLEKEKSPYAPLIRIVERQGELYKKAA